MFHLSDGVQLEFDDVQALSNSAPMPSAERFRFSSKDDTVSILFDKSDIYWSYARSLDNRSITEEINSWLEPYHAVLEGLGIEPSEDGLYLNLRLKWRNIVPLPARALFKYESTDNGYALELVSVKIGKLISLSPEQFKLDEAINTKYNLKTVHTILNNYKTSSLTEKGLEVVCRFDRTWLMRDIPMSLSDFIMILDLVRPEEGDAWVTLIEDYHKDNKEAFDSLCDSFDSDPGAFAESKMKMLATAGTYSISKYFKDCDEDIALRLIPEITNEKATNEYNRILSEYQSLYDERKEQLSELSAEIIKLYANGKLKVSGTKWINSEAGNAPFSLDQFEVGEKISKWNDGDGFCIVWAENMGDYLLKQVPKGNKVPIILFMGYKAPMYGYQYLQNSYWINYVNEKNYQDAIAGTSIPTVDLGKYTTKR